MKFGMLYEHQLPRPWTETSEQDLFNEALAQVELADRIGIDCVWAVEHHFLEEYCHSSAPEIFLAACAARTKRIHLGHGITLTPPPFNHPARIAERIATLDLVSGGRVEFGTGESGSLMELGGFNVPVDEKKDMWREGVEQVTNMMVMDPYPGFEGKYFSMPCRNVVPKPVQKPHPPLWVACSKRETILWAARHGMGALAFSFADPGEATQWVSDYYETFKTECVPIGHAVNPNIAVVSGFSCHEDADEAMRRGLDGFRFFAYALGHFYIYGEHQPGRTDVWQRFEQARDKMPTTKGASTIGTPDQLRESLSIYADAGVDQVIFIQQGGRNEHEHICESLQLFADKVMPQFKENEAERERQKAEELAPYIEAAMARKQGMEPLADKDIPVYPALGKEIVEQRLAGRDKIVDGDRGNLAVPLIDLADD
jgi:alkanesulfonate monooxygenase SsuD/methylene tetrahydromethanopterin reductase-like flavin-dependent oxidoreductase (luciferase family)